eukprot:373762-Rhodomonas_salina.7
MPITPTSNPLRWLLPAVALSCPRRSRPVRISFSIASVRWHQPTATHHFSTGHLEACTSVDAAVLTRRSFALSARSQLAAPTPRIASVPGIAQRTCRERRARGLGPFLQCAFPGSIIRYVIAKQRAG